jgi:uncharacterized protein
MQIIDELLDSLTDGVVLEVCIGAFWTTVAVEVDDVQRCGLAASLRNNNHHHTLRADVENAGHLTGQSARQLAGLIHSKSMLEASVGMAAINALLPAYEELCTDCNAEDVIIQHGAGRNVALVGHFPFVTHLRERVGTLWVLEQRPRGDDLPAHAAPDIIPQADVVAITSTALINHTLQDLLPLCRPEAHVLLLGPSTPLSPLLFEYGISFLSGVVVEKIEPILKAVSQGANFRQLHRQGIRLVTMEEPLTTNGTRY